jgi:hypothetical protein
VSATTAAAFIGRPTRARPGRTLCGRRTERQRDVEYAFDHPNVNLRDFARRGRSFGGGGFGEACTQGRTGTALYKMTRERPGNESRDSASTYGRISVAIACNMGQRIYVIGTPLQGRRGCPSTYGHAAAIRRETLAGTKRASQTGKGTTARCWLTRRIQTSSHDCHRPS